MRRTERKSIGTLMKPYLNDDVVVKGIDNVMPKGLRLDEVSYDTLINKVFVFIFYVHILDYEEYISPLVFASHLILFVLKWGSICLIIINLYNHLSEICF